LEAVLRCAHWREVLRAPSGAIARSENGQRFTGTVKDMQIRYRRPTMTDVRAEASLDATTTARIKREADTAGKTEFLLDAQLLHRLCFRWAAR